MAMLIVAGGWLFYPIAKSPADSVRNSSSGVGRGDIHRHCQCRAQEIRSVTRAFNQMSKGIQELEER